MTTSVPTIEAMIERAKKAAQSLTVIHDGEWKYLGIPINAECVIELNDEEGSTYPPVVLVRPRRYGRTTNGFMEVAHEGSALCWLFASRDDLVLLRSWRTSAETVGLLDAEGELTAVGLRLRAMINSAIPTDVREVLLRLIHEEVEWARIAARS